MNFFDDHTKLRNPDSNSSGFHTQGFFDPFQKSLGEMWHPHVYAYPPKRLTPFSINDILQHKSGQASNSEANKFQIHTSNLISLFGVNPVHFPLAQMEVANAMRSLAAALSATATPATRSSPSPSSTCASPSRGTSTTSKEDTSEQPLNLSNLSTSKSNLGQLQSVKNLKRRKSSGDGHCDPQPSGAGGDDDPKKKKVRTTFTGKQIYELEKMFETKKYLSSSERSEMAKLLKVTEQQVKIWFQNRRTKWKKQENISNAEAAELMKSKSNKDVTNVSSLTPRPRSETGNQPFEMDDLCDSNTNSKVQEESASSSPFGPSSAESGHSGYDGQEREKMDSKDSGSTICSDFEDSRHPLQENEDDSSDDKENNNDKKSPETATPSVLRSCNSSCESFRCSHDPLMEHHHHHLV